MNEQVLLAGPAGDEGEAEVLREAAAVMAEWVKRLPPGSPWKESFAVIGSEVAACADLHELPHRWRAA